MPTGAKLARPGKENMPALTGLRFLPAGLVMPYHVAGKQMPQAPTWIGNMVGCGYLSALTICLCFPNRFHAGLDQTSARPIPARHALPHRRLLDSGSGSAVPCLLAVRFAGPHLTALLTPDWFTSFIQYNPLFHVPAFVMGMATQRLYLMERSGALAASWRSAALSGFAMGAISLVLVAGWQILRILMNNGLMGLLFAALIFGLASGRGALAHVLAIPDSSWRFLAVDVAIAIAASILALKCAETPYRISITNALLKRIK